MYKKQTLLHSDECLVWSSLTFSSNYILNGTMSQQKFSFFVKWVTAWDIFNFKDSGRDWYYGVKRGKSLWWCFTMCMCTLKCVDLCTAPRGNADPNWLSPNAVRHYIVKNNSVSFHRVADTFLPGLACLPKKMPEKLPVFIPRSMLFI